MMNTVTEERSLSLPSYYPWLVWFLGASFYFYEFFIQVSPNVLVPELVSYFNVNATHLGIFTLIYFVAYASMQLPGGILLDKFGPRRLMTVAVLFCAIGSIAFASTKIFAMAEFARFITGLGSAFALLGTLVLIANWFPSKYFASLSGLLLTVGMTGAIVGEAPLAYAMEHFPWQNIMYLLGIVGLLLACFMWLFIRDRKDESKSLHKFHTPQRVYRNIQRILKDKHTWLTAIYGALMYMPTVVLGALWGISFLTARFGISRPHAAGIISFLFVGWAVGCPIFGAFSDWLRKRKPPLYIATLGVLICLLPLLYVPTLPHWLLGVLVALVGFFSSGFVIAFSICRELHSFDYSGTAMGFMNMINTLGAALAPLMVGLFMDISLGHRVAHTDGQLNYSAHNYVTAMSILPLLLLIALAIIPTLKETNCQSLAALKGRSKKT